MIVGSTLLSATKSFGALGSVPARAVAVGAVDASKAANAVIRARATVVSRVMPLRLSGAGAPWKGIACGVATTRRFRSRGLPISDRP
jgi:hypothetical protein